MEQYINKVKVVAEIERIKKEECPTDLYEGICKLFWFERFLTFLDTLKIEEVDSNDAFIEKAWDWIEDNMLSSNQQDKLCFYYKQFENYMKGE